MENAILELQLEISGGSIECTILAPFLSFIIIVVKKALAELVYWYHVQARPKVSPSLKVFARQARLQTHLSANVRTQIDRDGCFTEVV